MTTPRTAIVTGATSGLGLITACLVASQPGWHVALAVRDAARERGGGLMSRLPGV